MISDESSEASAIVFLAKPPCFHQGLCTDKEEAVQYDSPIWISIRIAT